MKKRLLMLLILSVFALTAIPGSANALTLVAQISGQYSNAIGGGNPDTPNLWINNTTSDPFTNVTITGYAYQGINALLPAGTSYSSAGTQYRTQVRSLSDIAAGSNVLFSFTEGLFVCNNLPGDYFAYDYDDSYGCSSAMQPGNVEFTFAATWNSQSIYAQFSPDVNATGGFVGFLGLDELGYAESSYDAGGAASGVGDSGLLAQIYVGNPPPPGSTTVPEPSTLMLFGSGLFGIGLFARKKFVK